MAFIIPSKNIYDIQNPKVRDNLIDNVAVEQTVITPNNEYEVTVYNENVKLNNLVSEENSTKESFVSDVENDDVSVWYNFGYVYFDNVAKYKEETITIKKNIKNNYISKIFTEKDEQGNSKIGVSLRGNIVTQDTSASVVVTSFPISHTRTEITYSNKQTQTAQIIQFPKMPIEIKSPIIYGVGTGASVVGLSNKTNYAISVWDDNDNYYIKYKILVYLLVNQVNGGQIEVPDIFGNTTFDVKGTYTEYNTEQLEITIYGNTIGIDLTDGTVDYGSGNKPHTLSGNELMQDSAVIGARKVTEWLANGVLNQYKQGKETAVLLCSIDDDLNFFELGAIVEPYVLGANGKDVPMSRYPNSEPKQFVVVGTRIFYDGAVWQEITIQEYVK